MVKPLDGILVVSFEQAVAAPFASRQLADLGARVIKVERDAGDFARGYDSTVKGLASYFVWLNRSKESLVLDLKSERGRDDARRLVAKADVVIQNLSPGAMDRLGLGVEDLMSLNPRLIYASISGYGDTGPYHTKKAYDLLVQCEAGLLSITGTPESPSKVGISVADIAAGMYAYSGVLSALIQRGRTGKGQNIEVSMLEALAEWMGQPYYYSEYGDGPPARTGAAHATIAPYGPFGCSDGTVFLAIQNEPEWMRFCDGVIARPELSGDARFSSNALRVRNRAELEGVIKSVLGAIRRADVLALLDDAGIASGELRDIYGLATHPQLEARNRWRVIDSPAGPLRALLPPVTAGWEHRMDRVPEVGEHTEIILQELRGGAEEGIR